MKERSFNFLRWTPIAVSIGLVALIAVISARTVEEINQATYWRQHTYQVILDAQSEEDSLIDAQNRVRHYATEGKPDFLIEYQNDTNSELQEFKKLAELTRDNPEQQQRLKDLSAAIKAVFDYDNRVIGVYARQGAEAALKMEEAHESGDVLETAIKDLDKFKAEEQKLLAGRDATEKKDYHKAARWLVVGSIVAALLLVGSNYFASREMARRRRAEIRQRELIEELQKTLAEVKTLSGLIPICGWCKSVRSDTGYWQSVEQYVRAHTDATFTHGMCPSCSDKWKADALKASRARALASHG